MKLTKLIFCLFVLLSHFSLTTQAAEETSQEDLLRCERFVKSNLKELKQKLQENCDLSKPFSTSLAINIGEDHFMYCCHKKK